ncbi:OmpP1/FadL family transporter [Aquitalea sp. LB_tupeE]|uniref:OmpP1/FadL family transporter n=1 Tax=Aquitalea sp. LB_tupeE TaxID=2748078 RepID=UPI0015C017E0|nr:OmpP1/FadL family transporter [Aquitalea sp. LB_tupeE]NWK76336.1 outer membrane protein transport protein [Aquitalea sp. LB_tupeE]
MKLKHLSQSVMLMGVAVGAFSSTALASGYNFGSQSVSAQGTAHANAAEAADASIIYYNPAGLSLLEGTQISVGATTVLPDSSYTDTGSKRAVSTLPLKGNNGGSYAPSAVIAPTFYMSSKLNDKVTVGLGMFVPYGAQLDYGNSWIGRYAIESIKLETLNINPSISFKLDDKQSLGFGLSAQYMKAHLTKAVDVGSGAYSTLVGLYGASIGGAVAAGLGDGQAGMSADGWGYGFNLGYMYQLDEHTRFGLAYRSEIHQTLDGSATWDFSQVGNSTIAAQAAAQHPNSSAQVKVVTPQSASASFYHDLNERVAIMGTATWTGHSSMQNIDIKFPGTSEGDLIINQKWKNSWMFALGANYKYSDKLLFRTGLAYDQSPVSSEQLTHPALPDGDRYWISFGANYKFDKHNSVDVSYSYVQVKNVHINYSDVCSGQASCSYTGNGETTTGDYKTNLQLIGLQYNYSF